MSEVTVSRLVYVGRRKLSKSKVLVAAFTDPENPSTSSFTTFEKKKLSVPYPIGTVIAFERTESGSWKMAWGSTAKPEGLFHDRELVQAWEIAAGVDAASEREEKLLAKEGRVLDHCIDEIVASISRLPSFDRTAARAYVVAKIMGVK